MKIAIISDIHGNALALDAVLKKVEELDAERIFCLGDLAMAGYDPNYTIEKMRELETLGTATIIQGNTDKLIVNYSDEIFEIVENALNVMAQALKDDVKIIKPENIEFLRALPEKLELVEEGIERFRCAPHTAHAIKICLCHGSPRRQDENLYPDTAMETLEGATSATDADLIFCGHTHLPCGWQMENGKTVVNVGSVGRPMQEGANAKTPVFVLLEIHENATFTVEHHFVPYNNQLAYEKVLERGFLHCEELAQMFIKKENK